MRIVPRKRLLDWDAFEPTPDLKIVLWILNILPDEKLIHAIRRARGKGRNDYPPLVCWRVFLLLFLLNYPSRQACLDELRRNPALRKVVGVFWPAEVPSASAMSRFQRKLGMEPFASLMRKVFEDLIKRLQKEIKDLGASLAGDASGLAARRDDPAPGEKRPDHLPIPKGGRKEYKDENGVVTETVEWFGYAMHLIVDSVYEVVLGWTMTDANTHDAEVFPDLLKDVCERLPKGRPQILTYDRAADSEAIHRDCMNRKIKPVIKARRMWKSEPERPLPGHEGDNLVYDEDGVVYCYDMSGKKPIRHAMYFDGYENKRGTLKYRCPAKAQGWNCPYSDHCNGTRSYGRTVRVRCSDDPRRFPPVPRNTKTFTRLHNQRTAVERVNCRIKKQSGLHTDVLAGAARCLAAVSGAMIIHAAKALFLSVHRDEKHTLGGTKITGKPYYPKHDRMLAAG